MRAEMRTATSVFAASLQDTISLKLEEIDGGKFREDTWQRPGGGGGRTRVLEDGKLFEKAGVSYSEVEGQMSEDLGASLPGEGDEFYATGVSLVLHPRHPRVPTVHANFRYVEKGDAWWFGGGADLTPYRLYAEDARHFHGVWKDACDLHDPDYYPRFKTWCDEYFYLPHRQEARGVGGIFFDHLTGDGDRLFAFWKEVGGAFLQAYVPIVERRRGEDSTDEEREFQLIRRGRYVEFNLMYDRGTLFGLKTGGRIESIRMSLPPRVSWGYDVGPRPGSYQEELLEVIREPRDWIGSEG